MTVFRCQAVLPFRTNIPTDVITNTFHFDSGDVVISLEDFATDIAPLVSGFYLDVYALGIAAYVRYEVAYTKWYDLSQPEPRVPIINTDLGTALGTNVTGATSQLPTEVAAVLSFQGTPQPGVAQSRRRGRVYLGGLTDPMITAAAGTTPFFPLWESAFLTDVADAAEALMNGVQVANPDYRWVVWSQVGSFATEIVDGWVDTSPDTQRRRGIAATSRLAWP